ncbi:MAG: hypothetical protein LQ338_002154 [Usnochroma carphineum]|nr:MAG: hypothetical protein LQ338_002154 [Usnochroma carphineum]
MTSTELNLIAPLDSPLPPVPEGDVFSESQWTTLLAIANTIIPGIEASSTPSLDSLSVQPSKYTNAVEEIQAGVPKNAPSDCVQRYLAERASSVPRFRELLQRTFGQYVRQDALKGIRVILAALDWSQSYLRPLRQMAKSLAALSVATYVKESPTINPILGFPRAPVHGKPGKDFDYSFLQLPPGDDQEVIKTDVVIVGSGCGGGVCAKNLAEAGHRVLVADRAYHFSARHLPMSSTDAGIHLFHNGGIDTSDDNSVSFIAGQAWGGGGTINWSASVQTQGLVRQEWADEGLPFFTSTEFQNCLDRVCQRMGVSTKHIEHNENNRVMLEGARKLGYSVKEVPQNTGGNKHYCGYCTLGCGAAEKQGPVVSWLPDAANAGAKFIEGFEADRIIFDTSKGKKIATGVLGTWTSRDSHGGVSGSDRTKRSLFIRAKRVIISCGTLHTPLLLLRSGLTNPQIGRNLHVHPATGVFATFPRRINPWEGGILTTVCDEFSNLDARGHGAKVNAMTMLPSWLLPFQPWRSGLDFKILASKVPRMCGHLAVVRDRDTGRVYPDPVDGRCRIAYTPSAFDSRNALECLLGICKIMYVMGAEEIWLTKSDVRPFSRDPDADADGEEGVNEPSFQAWLKEVRGKGMNQPETSWGSAHQMGTCRMSGSEKRGVVDSSGKVWGTEGLYVADASLFPSASGVNPMVTTMAISDMISRGVARGLRMEERVEEGAKL